MYLKCVLNNGRISRFKNPYYHFKFQRNKHANYYNVMPDLYTLRALNSVFNHYQKWDGSDSKLIMVYAWRKYNMDRWIAYYGIS